jgi:hypothetical protein
LYLPVIIVSESALTENLQYKIQKHQPDAIISFPSNSELEIYAKQNSVRYLGCAPFALTSAYFDHFLIFGPSVARHFHTTKHDTGENTYSFSKLSNESAFYSRFTPVKSHGAKALYQRDGRRKVLIITDSKDKSKRNTNIAHQICDYAVTYIKNLTCENSLILFGKDYSSLKRIEKILIAQGHSSVHKVQDHYRLSENSIYSLCHKADIIFTKSEATGLDAVMLGKPVVFIGCDSFLSKELNDIFLQSPKNQASFENLANNQFELLCKFLQFAEKQHLIFPNNQYSTQEMYNIFTLALGLYTKEKGNSSNIFSLSGYIASSMTYNPIIPCYNDESSKRKIAYETYLKKQAKYMKKFVKFKQDPHAFFRDSQYGVLRILRHII